LAVLSEYDAAFAVDADEVTSAHCGF
jgi:hypothetical protein